MPDAVSTRSLSCKKVKAHERLHHEQGRIHPAVPHAMVLTGYFALSPVIGLFVTVTRHDARASLPSLNASVEASGPHGFTVRISAFVKGASASTASRPASVTIASRPCWWDETAMDVEMIWGVWE
jgi:hypothetical protein